MTQHEANNGFVWVSDKTWNALNEQEKSWVQGAADEVARVQPGKALQLERDSGQRLKKIGVKVIEDVDKSGFISAATPIQDQIAKELGPDAVKILELIRNVK
jgi:TRAP-type C4-dicarboxylate transport system substrate-binding protein